MTVEIEAAFGGGIVSRRNASASFFVDSSAAALNSFIGDRLVDQDSNGLAEALALDFQVDVTDPGSFQLLGDIVRGTEVLASLSAFADFASSQLGQLTLTIPAEFFHQNGPGWDYELSGIQLWDDAASSLVGDLPIFPVPVHPVGAFETPSAPTIQFASFEQGEQPDTH